MRSLSALLITLALACAVQAAAPPEPEMFPFVMPWDDASPGVANLSGWNEKPAGAKGGVSVRNGHLWQGGKRLRLWGTNLTFGQCFPEHKNADLLAARLAKLGVNAVRFHHMDMFSAPAGIFKADMRTLDPAQMDRLDYLVAALKRQGIYTNLNLHVSRLYPGMPKWDGMPDFFKGVDLFHPPMLAMQREYARDLLTHVNPYTKTRYADESALAIVEINNENGLLMYWQNGSLDAMPEPYGAELTRQWNAFLSQRYGGNTEALRRAWDAREQPLRGEMLANPRFADSLTAWKLEEHQGAKADAAATVDGPDGAPAARIRVTEAGAQNWHVQFNQSGLSLKSDDLYTVSFRARADPPRRMAVDIGQAHDPWRVFGSQRVDLTPEWKEYRFAVRAPQDEPNARLNFTGLGSQTGAVWLSGVSLRPGGTTGPPADIRIGDIPFLRRSQYDASPEGLRRDWIAFLWETEERYWTGMARYIKDDLNYKGIVIGSAAGFTPAPIQAQLDAVDAHAYWQHPNFPGAAWDASNWTVNNVSMAGDAGGGTVADLARYRVAGKPFFVTEYNHPSPNTYSSEGMLLLAAYAALQDWDAVFQFDYGGAHVGDAPGRIGSFFTMDQHPTKLAVFPAAAALFRRADVAAPARWATVDVSPEMALEKAMVTGPWFGTDVFGIPRLAALRQPVAMSLTAKPKPAPDMARPEPPIAAPGESVVWDSRPDGRLVTVNTARSKAAVGFLSGKSLELGGVRIAPGANRQGWAAITLTAVDGRDLRAPGRILLTATGEVANTDMRWKNDARDSVGNQWGRAPTLVEGIPAEVTLPVPAARVRAWALDERGARREALKVSHDSGNARLSIGPKQRTLWYEIEVR